MHEHKYIHRDIKADNIVIHLDNGKPKYKLVDYNNFKYLCERVVESQNSPNHHR
jgi:serine/threonine protein kinase